MAENVPLMDVRGEFYLTNITNNVDVIITRTFLVAYCWKGWRPHRVRVDGHPLVSDGRSYEGMWSSRYNIPRGETREVHGNWLIEPPIKEPGKPVSGWAYFVDQLGNEHRAKKRLVFRYM